MAGSGEHGNKTSYSMKKGISSLGERVFAHEEFYFREGIIIKKEQNK